MKTTILLLFVAVLSYAQNGESNSGIISNYEFGSNLYSLTNFKLSTSRQTGKDYYSYDQNVLTGIFAKKHFNKNIVRVSFDYTKKIINQEINNLHTYIKDNGEINQGELRLGYEREFSSRKIVPFLCSDFVYSYSEAKGKASVYGDFVAYSDRPYLIKTNWYSVNVGAGLKIKITKTLLLTYECGLQYGYYYSRDNTSLYIREVSAKFSAFNPVRSLGLSVRF